MPTAEFWELAGVALVLLAMAFVYCMMFKIIK